MNPFTVLGVSSNASIEVARRAYRKLAMLHHPDRGGSAQRFKEVKAAWEQVEAGYRDAEAPRRAPEPPRWQSKPSSGFQSHHTEVVATPSLAEAYRGFNLELSGFSRTVKVSPGLPNGIRTQLVASDGSTVYVIMRIQPGRFSLRGVADNGFFDPGIRVGDTELIVEVDALDLITGAWLTTADFLGEPLSVRIPAGCNPQHPLKIVGKGYRAWELNYGGRADMYVKLQPIFRKPGDIDRQKIIDLYNLVRQ